MVAKLKAIKAELQRRKHHRTSEVGAWLRQVVLGYYQYHAVPGNTSQLRVFSRRVVWLWRNIAAANARPGFLTVLLTLFSFVALSLAAVGMYGVMAFLVAQRTREFGIRIAIGAVPTDVLALVLAQGMRMGLAGVAFGAFGAFVLTRLIRRLLFAVQSFDPLTFLITAAILTLVTAAACYIPARRATRVDPMIALRYE